MVYLGRIDDVVRIKLKGDVLESSEAKSTLLARVLKKLKDFCKKLKKIEKIMSKSEKLLKTICKKIQKNIFCNSGTRRHQGAHSLSCADY